ncbi:MAG: PAS domain-containing sensor histidine kinase [Bacteroidetes bacterium]|nr:MAG: PAS domain-containing sensor histidine kinase [Bacteroidota bacterium]
MALRLKTKLSLGLGFLFVVIVAFGTMGIYYINRLGNDAEMILKNNHESLVYANNMLKSLDMVMRDSASLNSFEKNLEKQETNITEPGEREATNELRKNFEELKANPKDPSNYEQIRTSIQQINDLNQQAILRKNNVARQTAEDAKLWLTIIFTLLMLIAFSFIYNLPGVISNPIRSLSEGISAIANKDYQMRIRLEQNDEFGDLANAFNVMAEKLDEYEHSNIAQIKFEKSRIEAIINQMKDGIIGLDDKKHILFLNEISEKLLGLKESEIVGQYAADIAIKNDLMRTLLQDVNGKSELKIYADNKESYFSKEIIDVITNGQVIGQVIVLRNITFFRELNEAKTNFIATVSHELKTPISSIKMSAQLLEDERVGKLGAEQKELITGIHEDAERLLKITGELLNMAQVETGNIQLKLQATQPSTIIDEALQAVLVQAEQKEISFKKSESNGLPLVNIDAEKTAWVLINFLTNAIKYSMEESTIELGAISKEKEVEFYVQDHGLGIDEKYLPKIFDRYYKVPGTLDRAGTGLGLAISKEFIEAQGGTIKAESKIGEGSRFSFTLKSV